jgi:PTH1 family peptidyl-tRNA hydrolase
MTDERYVYIFPLKLHHFPSVEVPIEHCGRSPASENLRNDSEDAAPEQLLPSSYGTPTSSVPTGAGAKGRKEAEARRIMAAVPVFKSPHRFLFIASIGNLPAPYTLTRHSAGHSLLSALEPLLQDRIGLTNASISSSSSCSSLFYRTWKCPALMNVSGPPTVRQLKTWLADHQRIFQKMATPASAAQTQTLRLRRAGREDIDLDVRELMQFRPTLVLLHDELEAQPGQVKVKRGGPQQASLRGHRGLISVMESLHGSGLLNPKNPISLAILRIGVGIGRPTSRERDAVADYVLTKMSPKELGVVQAAAPQVVGILVQEMYRRDQE